MMLEMYLDGELVDTNSVCAPLLRNPRYLKELMAELEKKYAAVLSKFDVKPVYVLCGVPSCMNGFVPLRHPDNPKTQVPAMPTPVQPSIATASGHISADLCAASAAPTKQLMGGKQKKVA